MYGRTKFIAGRDRYGEYTNMTGFEKPGKCFWCGIDVRKGRRFCCNEHGDNYNNHFNWRFASAWCYERYKDRCGHCGSRFMTEVHHIIPLDGEFRTYNIKNRPENLILLCHECHLKAHEELRQVERQKLIDNAELNNKQLNLL